MRFPARQCAGVQGTGGVVLLQQRLGKRDDYTLYFTICDRDSHEINFSPGMSDIALDFTEEVLRGVTTWHTCMRCDHPWLQQ